MKIVFVRNRTNKGEWLAVLSTDLTISDEEIIRIYGNRWSIMPTFQLCRCFSGSYGSKPILGILTLPNCVERV